MMPRLCRGSYARPRDRHAGSRGAARFTARDSAQQQGNCGRAKVEIRSERLDIAGLRLWPLSAADSCAESSPSLIAGGGGGARVVAIIRFGARNTGSEAAGLPGRRLYPAAPC